MHTTAHGTQAGTIYLDYAATTPVDQGIAAQLHQHTLSHFGNPSAAYTEGLGARRLLEDARDRISAALGADDPSARVLFTSGATEAMGLAILGQATERPHHGVIDAGAHACGLQAMARLRRLHRWRVDSAPLTPDGRVDPSRLSEHLDVHTRLVVLTLANNETGAINDVAMLTTLIRAHSPRARVVVDATQALGRLPLRTTFEVADCVALSAHKAHGPKGVGLLWTRCALEPVFGGGGQEGGMRGGTPSAPLAWAMSTTLLHAIERQRTRPSEEALLITRLVDGLKAHVPEVVLEGPEAPHRLCNLALLHWPGLPGGPLLNAVHARGVSVSSGSACRTHHRTDFSHVLEAMGREAKAGAWLRVSLGRETTEADIDACIVRIAEAGQSLAHLLEPTR
ncbi:MAG: cysteine desulfurase family protein [Bradymonadia bacterium]